MRIFRLSDITLTLMPRILIVEDDHDIAALIAHYLEKAGYAS